MRLVTECREEILADLHLALLRIAHPEFRFTAELRPPGRYHWVAVRRTLAAGLHTVVTDDLDELLAVLGPTDLPGQPADRDLAEVVVLSARRTGSYRPAPDTRLLINWWRQLRKAIKRSGVR